MKPCTPRTPRRGSGFALAPKSESGLALVIVLLVLLALLVLATPFLSMSRNADRASAHLADRAEARVALDAAERHATHVLGLSHPAIDPTPYFDAADELAVDNRFDPAFYDANDPHGVMWDVDAEDVAARIDLNSAGPHVLANLIGAATRFTRAIEDDDEALPVASASGFETVGFLWAGGERIRYEAVEDGAFARLTRGLLAKKDADGEWLDGPRPPIEHEAGEPVLDERAFAPAQWRIATDTGEPRVLQSAAELSEVAEFMLARIASAPDGAGTGATGSRPDAAAARCASCDEAVSEWTRLGSVHAQVRGGRTWQRAARLTSRVRGGIDGRLRVDLPTWFNPGTTIRVEDGDSAEMAIVQAVTREGEILLDRILEGTYEAYEAEVRVQVRRPVNVNTAPGEVLEALFTNLQLAGRNARITAQEARALASLVVASRPFEGHEDFLRRIVLPAAGLEKLPADAPVVPPSLAGGGALIDPDDALALYTNALNANHVSLAFSTMPLCYTSRDVYALELRASVNGKSGAERTSAVRDAVELVVPQRELLCVWARQEDFDEALRLDREAPLWTSGPSATSRWDDGATPPSRVWAHLGTFEGQAYLPGVTPEPKDPTSTPTAEHVFASRESDGWAQLWASRVEETDRLQGRVLHFDQESRDPEGRYLPDEIVALPTEEGGDNPVRWTGPDAPLLRPLSFSLWVDPRSVADSILLDLGGTDRESDRLSLVLEGGDLVLRVIDGTGDHRDTAFSEVGELRYALAAGTDPGMPVDTWTHVAVDVRGNRPDQMTMLVNGLTHGVRARGLTRLTSALTDSTQILAVESTEGFPPRCVARVGEELVEVEVDGETSMRATRYETGALAGFGGRGARIQFTGGDPDVPDADDFPEQFYDAGTSVELYGYSLPIAGRGVAAGEAALRNELGPYRVGRLVGVVNASQSEGDPISAGIVTVFGMEGEGSTVNGLVLASADSEIGSEIEDDSFMRAFDKNGGYAAIVQLAWNLDDGTNTSAEGTPLGGIEVIRYSGWTSSDEGPVLQIAARGNAVAGELPNYGAAQGGRMGGARAFVSNWAGYYWRGDPVEIQQQLDSAAYVLPISLPVPGASDLMGFLAAAAGESEFAQITEVDAAELTEWVRYDTFQATRGQLVRDDPFALDAAYVAATHGRSGSLDRPDDPDDPDDPNQPPHDFAKSAATPASASPARQSGVQSFQWLPAVGQSEDEDFPFSRAVSDALQFRGVLGTFGHTHAPGTRVLPAFGVVDGGPDVGRPGRLDAAFLVAGDPAHIGWPVVVHRANKPSVGVEVHGWTQQGLEPADSGSTTSVVQDGFDTELIRVALQERSPEPISPGTVSGTPAGTVDARTIGRLTLFPSGERPRVVSQVVVGGAFDSGAGGGSGATPSATVDEIVFGNARFAEQSDNPEATSGGQLRLVDTFGAGDETLRVDGGVRIAGARVFRANGFVNDLPEDAGLLRIGEEILAYDSRDPDTGLLTIAPSGRGLLGTREQSHGVTEPVTWLEGLAVSGLSGDVGAADARIPIEDAAEFPARFGGTLLVGEELVHYTWLADGALGMPRRSSEPGMLDGRGEGLFRGRFGTLPATHQAGEPVILFPFRYWDRWAPRADAPELAYFGFAADQPAAFWRSSFWTAEEASGAARIGVLQRTDASVPWDADPDATEGLDVQWEGRVDGGPIPVGEQSDRIEWRAFVQYQPGAFDLTTGLSHGWKETPRLRQLGVFYFGPGLRLASLDR